MWHSLYPLYLPIKEWSLYTAGSFSPCESILITTFSFSSFRFLFLASFRSFMNLPVTSIVYSIANELKVFVKILAFEGLPVFCFFNGLGSFRVYTLFFCIGNFHIDYSTKQ